MNLGYRKHIESKYPLKFVLLSKKDGSDNNIGRFLNCECILNSNFEFILSSSTINSRTNSDPESVLNRFPIRLKV